MPNFFVEAMTVSEGKIYTAVKELVVPPEKRVLNVDIIPSKEKYKPGENAKAKIKITDFFGKPLTTGSVVVTIYDKSVEYISGGSNVPEIKDFFWKWRRTHYSHSESNLDKFFYNLMKENELAMGPLGVFGNLSDGENESGAAYGFGGAIERKGEAMKSRSTGAAKSVMSTASAVTTMEMKSDNLGATADADTDAAAPREPETGGELGGGAEMAGVAVRKNFADTAFWTTKVTPNEKGEAEIELAMPENLTT